MPIIKKKFHELLILRNIRFVFADIDSTSKLQNIIIQELGFKFVVTWIDGFKKPAIRSTNCNKPDLTFGLLDEKELVYFSNIAKENYFKGGRFFLDYHFNENKVRGMYSSLVMNSCNQGISLVLRINKQPVGLFIVKSIIEYPSFDFLKVAHLRFLLIDPEFRGQGLGECLFDNTISYLNSKCDLIVTGLEINNIESLNLHARLGFKFNYAHNAYHFWNQTVLI
jgi:ribosomal protein S18 acetylase RimI-like enzyme